jgi:hypothetical protein
MTTLSVPRRAGIEITGAHAAVGFSPGDEIGEDVALAGDVNGDGIPDALLASCGYNLHGDTAPDYGNDDSGAGYVVFGTRARTSVSLDDFEGRGFLIQPGFVSPDYQSCHIAPAGDVNGDGLDDVIFGAPAASNNSRRDSGTAYVVFGKTDSQRVDLGTFDRNEQGTAGFRIDGAGSGDLAGFSIDGVGDLSGDGLDDVVVGAPFGPAAYVVFGRTGSAPVDLQSLDVGLPIGGYRIDHPQAWNIPAYQVAGVGDFNNDSVPDVLIGLKQHDEYGDGEAWVAFGHVDPSPDDVSSPEFVGVHVISSKPQSDIGYALDGAGDVNGDGFDDALVGVPNVIPANKFAHSPGAVYVVFGSASTDEIDVKQLGRRGFKIAAPRDTHLGLSVAGIEDANGDGLSDIATIGVRNGRGVAFVVYGRTSHKQVEVDDLGRHGYRIGFRRHDLYPVEGGEDFNGDGESDLVIGSSFAAQDRGKVFVVWGKP